jgi:hypothetical protein
MPAKPKLPGPQTDSRARGYCSPEEEELQRKREDLERLQSDLAEAELELATLRSDLAAFERKYLRVVGCRYAELDQLEAQIAEAIARRDPKNATARQQRQRAPSRLWVFLGFLQGVHVPEIAVHLLHVAYVATPHAQAFEERAISTLVSPLHR